MQAEDYIAEQIMAAQESGQEPLKVYRKAITGKVVARVLNPFSGSPAEVILYGIPGKVDNADIEISLWTPAEVKYFESMNRGLLNAGSLVVVPCRSEYTVNTYNVMSDEELQELCSSFMRLKNTLPKITSETTLQRLLDIAIAENKPARTLGIIKERLADVQQES